MISFAESDIAEEKLSSISPFTLLPKGLGPQLVAVFKSGLANRQITGAIGRITQKIQQKYPPAKKIFIEPAAGV